MGIDGLVVIGGNGSLTVACKLHHDLDLPIVGVPKTIDNDIVGTDMTFGFTTAVQIATDAIDRLHTTAESHDRVMIVEVMGRHSGWIATYAGIAGGATAILIPEEPFDIDNICELLHRRHERGRYASIVVVAEGAEPRRRHDADAREDLRPIRPCPTRRHCRHHRPRHRGAYRPGDQGGAARARAARRHAVGVRQGARRPATALPRSMRCTMREWGKMAVLRGTDVSMIPLDETVGKTRYVDLHLYHDVAEVFFG